jgi:stearoyl-CoA desaturase (delta-9 desaturase)
LILALSLLSGALFLPVLAGPALLAALLWVGPLRLLLALHVQCSVNSLCHLGPIDGKAGSSKNVAWLTAFHMGQGENWHRNHHRAQNSARLGERWWQVDLGWWTILGLRRLGLASRVRTGERSGAS